MQIFHTYVGGHLSQAETRLKAHRIGQTTYPDGTIWTLVTLKILRCFFKCHAFKETLGQSITSCQKGLYNEKVHCTREERLNLNWKSLYHFGPFGLRAEKIGTELCSPLRSSNLEGHCKIVRQNHGDASEKEGFIEMNCPSLMCCNWLPLPVPPFPQNESSKNSLLSVGIKSHNETRETMSESTHCHNMSQHVTTCQGTVNPAGMRQKRLRPDRLKSWHYVQAQCAESAPRPRRPLPRLKTLVPRKSIKIPGICDIGYRML